MVDSQPVSASAIETITIEDSNDADEVRLNTVDDAINDNQTEKSFTSCISSFIYSDSELNDQDKQDNIQTQAPQLQNDTSPSTSNGSNFTFGPYVPIFRKDNDIFIDPNGIINSYFETNPNPISKRLACEVLPDDTIIDTPSLVTPLLLKKKSKLPPRQVTSAVDEQVPQNLENSGQSTGPSSEYNAIGIDRQEASVDINHRPVDDYIRATCVASLTSPRSRTGAQQSISTLNDYYKSSVGKLLLGIGLSRAREFQLEDNARKLTRKIKKAGSDCEASDIELLQVVKEQLKQTRASNKIYEPSELLKCPICDFETEFAIVMRGHLETPHINKKDYMCNWCDFKTNDSAGIVYHSIVKHKRRCRIEKPLALHLCTYCPFENRDKRRWKTHFFKCEQRFQLNTSFLGPQDYGENEFPTITSKFITQEDIRTFDNTLKTLRLAAYNPHQIKISGLPQNSNLPIVVVSRQEGQPGYKLVGGDQLLAFNAALANPSLHMRSKESAGNASSIESQNNHSAQLLQLLSGQNPNSIQSRNGILQYPRTQSPFMNGNSALKAASDFVMGPHSVTHPDDVTSQPINTNDLNQNEGEPNSNQTFVSAKSSAPNSKGCTFVICEICDGYIKDLGQLKSHMQWIHRVKIHHRMLISKPPLNCQKCQWRFFTDQGLERHLLGAHGLVTSNMQELVLKGCDSGRCTICGKAYANKLVAHMREVHKLTTKPAHLTYKCTVCSATFNLYRLFENHVYSVHNESVRHISTN